MLLTRYNPYNELERMRKSFELMNSIFSDIERASGQDSISSFLPKVNTREDDKAYYIEVDLPGVSKEDIEITTEDNVLTISGERKLKEEAKEEDYYKVESFYGHFSRSFTLPEDVDVKNIEAKNENGVLEIVIPKKEDESKKPKKIEIK